MFRDKYKNEEYFKKSLKFNIKAFDEFEAMKSNINESRVHRFYLFQSGYSKKIVTISCSLGLPHEEVFKWFKISLYYYQMFYERKGNIYSIIDYLSLAVLFEDRKEEFIEDIEKLFNKYMTFVGEGEQLQEDYIEFLAMYLLRGERVNYHSHLEYLNLMGDTADSVIEAQKFWYYAHSEAAWYDTHKTEDAYYGYWSFDTAALCKIRGIYDERLKDLDYFPYDLLVQKDH
ncbi:PoNe immunity protein domain-containing protein [Streptococcus dentapri]|uniref:PoNe immunity protein domain-containing protein n=1 Tax=Streptococcus dentapri TaxID=573564 RepID=A0ABV8D2Z3_9STRE